MEEYVRTATECAVCLDVFKEPKTLFCLHTFCNACVRNVTNNHQITCPICLAVSAEEDVRDDFRIKELLQIRTNRLDTVGFTAKQQATDHLKNLQFFRDQYQSRLDKINDSSKLLKTKLIDQVRSNKRAFIAAMEIKCAATEAEIDERVMNSDVIKRARQTIADIDARVNEVKGALTDDTAGTPSVGTTKRFGQELVDFAERGPPENFTAKQPDIPFATRSHTDCSLDCIGRLCYNFVLRKASSVTNATTIRVNDVRYKIESQSHAGLHSSSNE